MKAQLLFFILCLLTLLKTGSVLAQEPYFLAEKTKANPKYMIRIDDKDTTLYQFSWRYGKMGYYPILVSEYPLHPESLQFDPKTKGYFYQIEAERWKDRQKMLFVQQHDSLALPYFRQAAWMQQYEALDREMDTLYPFHSLSYYDIFWDYKDSAVAFEAIPQWTTEKIAALRDQTIRTYAPLDSCYQHILTSIQTISYAETQTGFRLLAGESLSYRSPGYAYFDALLSRVAVNRPEFIFQLEKDLPQFQDQMIRMLSYDNSARKSLKAAGKEEPFTKAVRKERRNTVLLGILGGTLSVAVDGAVIYGIVWLIRR